MKDLKFLFHSCVCKLICLEQSLYSKLTWEMLYISNHKILFEDQNIRWVLSLVPSWGPCPLVRWTTSVVLRSLCFLESTQHVVVFYQGPVADHFRIMLNNKKNNAKRRLLDMPFNFNLALFSKISQLLIFNCFVLA